MDVIIGGFISLVMGAIIGHLLTLSRHSCKWKILSTHFTAPNPHWGKINGESNTVATFERRRNEGITHVYLQCETCGQVKEQDFYGKFESGATLKDDELAQLRKMTGMES